MALTGAMLVADPEMTIPLLMYTHRRKTLGALLMAYAVYFALIAIVLFAIGFTRPIGRVMLVGAVVMGLAAVYFLFASKKQHHQ